MKEPFETLIAAAILAPSGDNTQPWRFEIDETESTIDVAVDESRDPSPMNAGQRMSRIACGAAIENILRTARHNDWDVEYQNGRIPRIRIGPPSDIPGEIEPVLRERVTNRRRYTRKLLSKALMNRLKSVAPAADSIRIYWIAEPDRIRQFARVLGRADALMFQQPEFLHAFMTNVHTRPHGEQDTRRGLPLGTLEMGFFECLAFPLLRHTPSWAVRGGFLRPAFYRKAYKSVASSSGLCVITSHGASGTADYDVGRTMQRAWLELASFDLAVQPMMSLPVLTSAMCEHRGDAARLALLDSNIDLLEQRGKKLLGARCPEPIRLILRFGVAEKPSNRTGRIPANHVTDIRDRVQQSTF